MIDPKWLADFNQATENLSRIDSEIATLSTSLDKLEAKRATKRVKTVTDGNYTRVSDLGDGRDNRGGSRSLSDEIFNLEKLIREKQQEWREALQVQIDLKSDYSYQYRLYKESLL